MRISSKIRLCVAYIAAPTVIGDAVLGGTGFFIFKSMTDVPHKEVDRVGVKVVKNAFGFFVTARHVVEQVISLGAENMLVRVNVKNGGYAEFLAPVADFYFHDEPEVDLAIVPTKFDQDIFEIIPWILEDVHQDTTFQENNIGVGTGISIIGLFKHHTGKTRNLPIVRTGNVAAMAEEKVLTKMGLMDAFLIEARSIGGLSGSPVFANLGVSQTAQNPTYSKYDFISGIYLFGVMHGHYDESSQGEKLNVGIGIVTPLSKLEELVDKVISAGISKGLAITEESRFR